MCWINDISRLLISTVGFFVSNSYFGIMQESITRGRYGKEMNEDGMIGERYTFSLALVAVQCIFNWLFAKGKHKVLSKTSRLSHVTSHNCFNLAILIARPQDNDNTHQGFYASSALTYLLAMVSSNMALRILPYPTQVVAKSARPATVTLLGVLIGRKSYALQKYLFLLIIVLGVVLFMYKEGEINTSSENSGLGELLLCISLLMDGLKGAIHERMRAASKPSALHMMFSMNFWSSLMLSVALVITGEGKEFLAFALKHPDLQMHLIMLALSGAFGQLFIFIMVSSSGPLTCAIITTTARILTVLCFESASNHLWFEAAFVLIGVVAYILYG